jgi:hypothetical protein
MMISFVNLTQHQLWDIGGVDGLQVAQTLFGESVQRLSPFQSLETSLEGLSCSVLRLCEGNFRIACNGADQILEQHLRAAQPGRQVWVKQLPWLSAIALPDAIGMVHLQNLAVPKPPHRLTGLPLHCATPARIDGISVLIWRHLIAQQPAIELHTAANQVDVMMGKIKNQK